MKKVIYKYKFKGPDLFGASVTRMLNGYLYLNVPTFLTNEMGLCLQGDLTAYQSKTVLLLKFHSY